MIYVIYGEERFLMNKKLEALKKEYRCNEENMNISTYRATDSSMEEVFEDLTTPPFFTEKKMVVLKNPYFLTSKKAKKENNDDRLFLEYLKRDNDDTIFVIYHDVKDFDERKKIVKELRKCSTFFEIDKVNHYKLKDTTRQAITRREAVIDDDAIDLLLSRVGNNLEEVSREVEKLCLYTKHIDIHAVDILVTKPLEENVFQLTSALLNKERQKMFSIYQDLLVLNEEPVKLIVLIANQMRLLYQVKLLDRKGYTDKEIASILAVNPYRLKYVRQEGKEFDVQQLLQCLDQLSTLDIKIKTGKVDKQLGLELFMLKV